MRIVLADYAGIRAPRMLSKQNSDEHTSSNSSIEGVASVRCRQLRAGAGLIQAIDILQINASLAPPRRSRLSHYLLPAGIPGSNQELQDGVRPGECTLVAVSD